MRIASDPTPPCSPRQAASAGAAAADGGSTLVIRHQLKGCHSWSAKGDAYKASQTLIVQC